MLELPGPPQPAPAPDAPRWLVGRNPERHAALSAFARGARLVTLIGLGGVGKTTLAQRLARDLHSRPHPAVWVDCSLLTHASHLLPALVAALGLPSDLRADPAERLAAHLRSHPALLVLDNLEQLHDAFAPIAALLHASPDVRLLATSRSALHLRQEHLVLVSPFAVPDEHDPLEALRRNDAVTLFVRHARTVRPAFDLDARNAGDVVRLCRRLDGLPLALELAARHMDVFTPDALLALLNDHPLLLEGDVDRHERHRSLHALLDGTYALLDDGERRVYRHLALFGGGFDALDVHALLRASPGGPLAEASSFALDLVRTLLKFARGGLLVQSAPSEQPTFRMLETLRVDAWRRLEAAQERADAERAHAHHFRDLLRGWKMPLRHEFLRALRERKDDLHRAFEWFVSRPAADAGASQDAFAMGRSLATLWAEDGALREGEMRLRRALARSGGGAADRAAATIALASLLSPMGRHDEALRLAESAEGDLDDFDDHVARVAALDRFATVCAAAGAYDRARAVREQLIALKERGGFTPICVDRDRLHLASLLAGGGQHEEARAHFVELVDRARRRHDHWNTVVAALGLSTSQAELGHLDEAEATLHLALAVARDFPHLGRHLAAALLLLDVRRGATPDTARRLQDAAASFEDHGHRVLAADCLVALGFALLHLGRAEEAHDVAQGRALAVRAAGRGGPMHATIELLMGACLHALDRPGDAERFLRRALTEPLRRARPLVYAFTLLVLAEGQERLGRLDEARALRAREATLVRERGLRRWPIVQARRDAVPAVPSAPFVPAAPVATPVAPRLDLSTSSAAPALLSVREREVLLLLGAGRTNKQIGKALSLSENTVRAHARSIFQKIGGRTRTEVVASALRLGLLRLPSSPGGLPVDPSR